MIFLAKHLRTSQWQTLSIPRGKSEDYGKPRDRKHIVAERTKRSRDRESMARRNNHPEQFIFAALAETTEMQFRRCRIIRLFF